MKKFFLISIFSCLLCIAGCGHDCGPFSYPKLTSAEANLTTVNEEGSIPVASDMRLSVSLAVKYVTQRPVSMSFVQAAYACSPAPVRFHDPITELSLTCNKTIRGFAPGQNILTSSADVYFYESVYSQYPTIITLVQWLNALNFGDVIEGGNYYGDGPYDVSIAFIPAGTDVPAGEYTFSFTLTLRSGTKYTKEFSSVHIAALS